MGTFGSAAAAAASGYGSAASVTSAASSVGAHHQLNPYDRSMYPYNTPGAFVPHSAINLSVKPNEGPIVPGPSSLDLTMTDAMGTTSTGGAATGGGGGGGGTAANGGANTGGGTR